MQRKKEKKLDRESSSIELTLALSQAIHDHVELTIISTQKKKRTNHHNPTLYFINFRTFLAIFLATTIQLEEFLH